MRRASSHGDKTQVEMAKLWQEQISDRLTSLGFDRVNSINYQPLLR